MLCRIADLIVEVPAAGGMAPRCENYLCHSDAVADIVIRNELYRTDNYPDMDEDTIAYMESGFYFARDLLRYGGVYLHASAVEKDGRAYLFSGPCGVGKSTHSKLWLQTFGDSVRVFNDDKPVLRRMEDHWYAYGTPWCGKDGININMKVPLVGICFLKRGEENRIRRLEPRAAVSLFLTQTLRNFKDRSNTGFLLENLDRLVREIPIYELESRPEPEAARLSYETMRRGAQEAGL